MLKELKFVQGAVAKKDLMPAMTHFAIEQGHVRSYNGVLALSSPIPFDIDCKPKAAPLVQAISHCEETVALSMTPAGKLRIQSGAFRAFVECVEGETAHVMPEGTTVHFNGAALLSALRTVSPFIGNDASRPWSNGILLDGASAFATNNVCLIEYWVGDQFPHRVNIPEVAVREILRIGEAPTHGQIGERSMTFHYTDGRWIRTQLLSTEWPDLTKILDRECNAEPIDLRIFDGLKTLKNFVDKMGRIIFDEGVMRTHFDEGMGAAFDLPESKTVGIYRLEMLQLLQGIAERIDFTTYPAPCLFFGDRVRGAIIGMRQ